MGKKTNFKIENGVLKKYCEEPGVTEVVIPEGVTTIGKKAFHGCSSLTSVTIPGSVTSIGEDTFCKCKGLTDVTLSTGLKSIGGRAFCECEALTSIDIPHGVSDDGVIFRGDGILSGMYGFVNEAAL